MTIDREKLKALADAAFFGGWFACGDLRYAEQKTGEIHGLHHEDDRFIAACSPAAILNMLEETGQLKAENERFDEGMRSIASSLGAGGYNAEHLSATELVGKVRWGVDHLCDTHERRITELKAEIEALRKDAERYRWLREASDFDALQHQVFCKAYGAALDELIDQAVRYQEAKQ